MTVPSMIAARPTLQNVILPMSRAVRKSIAASILEKSQTAGTSILRICWKSNIGLSRIPMSGLLRALVSQNTVEPVNG